VENHSENVALAEKSENSSTGYLQMHKRVSEYPEDASLSIELESKVNQKEARRRKALSSMV
jgi:hypothetical protein